MFLRRGRTYQDGAAPLILFDFDGVVADSLEIFHREISAACAEIGFDRFQSKDALLQLFEGNLFRQLLKAGFPMFRLKRFAERFGPRIREATLKVEPFQGMPGVVSELAARHVVYVITSNESAFVEDFMGRFGISGVREVIGGDKEKSKIKKIRAVMRQHPGHVPYYIGDTKGDMLEARRAGAIAVAVTWGWHQAGKLIEGKPRHVVDTPEMLRQLFLQTG